MTAPEISPVELRDRLAQPDSPWLIVDCRTDDERALAHVPGSMWIPLHELELRLDELEPYRDRPIAVMCHHGRRSMRAAELLRRSGFGQVWSVAGGIDAWSRTVDPAVPRYEHRMGQWRRLDPGTAG